MNKYLRSYLPLVDFLADCLGDSTEVVLHDLTDWHQSVVAIRNGHISGRVVGSPITDLSLNVLKTASFEKLPYMANYQGVAKNGHQLKSSTYFIKDEDGQMVGMLCINSDYHALSEAYEKLGSVITALGLQGNTGIKENFNMNVGDLVQANIKRICPNIEEQVGRMSQKDKLEIVEGLNDMGTFLVKGAIGCVAENLGVSVPTIYRYLNMIKK
ncbi:MULTISPECIES: helix-turn-helix transcriptional regulator [Anaerotruncus]|uniref:helix-turn-helix transcriptional regulator n=1 Tax=Anaerotruncus TaxID=244127 RepID=UPI00082FAB5F|nr:MULTISPECIES: PAS domain-containing protein [Anaerotruncus]RGX55257.1 transcriptional regulator [Anaerotruncus sp. AF02-27]